MPSAEEEGKSLSNPDFWNSRYSVSDGSNPTHEWFRSYEALRPFLKKHLLPAEGCESGEGEKGKGNGPRILHLGSGDSVSEIHKKRYGRERLGGFGVGWCADGGWYRLFRKTLRSKRGIGIRFVWIFRRLWLG